jgi:hypothetical protein
MSATSMIAADRFTLVSSGKQRTDLLLRQVRNRRIATPGQALRLV